MRLKMAFTTVDYDSYNQDVWLPNALSHIVDKYVYIVDSSINMEAQIRYATMGLLTPRGSSWMRFVRENS